MGKKKRKGRKRDSSSSSSSTFQSTAAPFPERLNVLLFDKPPVSKDVALKHAWNINDRSLNIRVNKDDETVITRKPVCQSTDCIRGKMGYSEGLHLWEINWPTEERGTHAVVGVATKKAAPLHYCRGYRSLVGGDDQSWGWDLGRNKLYHRGEGENPFYPSSDDKKNFLVPDKFYVALDMDQGTLAFVANNEYLGIAFRGLKGERLFPIVSIVWGNCQISIRYIGGLDPEPSLLTDLCRRTIRRRVVDKTERKMREGFKFLPEIIIRYLLYKEEEEEEEEKEENDDK